MQENLSRFEISNIIQVMGYGASVPLLVRSKEGQNIILKTKYNATDETGARLFSELFCYLFLQKRKFKNIPNVCLLDITEQTIDLAKDNLQEAIPREQEALNNIQKSIGINLGIVFINNATKPTNRDYIKTFKNSACLYDGILMNTDRTKDNPNILINTQGELFLIDFNLALDNICLSLNDFVRDEIYPNEKYFTKNTFEKDYLFFDFLQKVTMSQNILNFNEINAIIRCIPQEWLSLNEAQTQALANIICTRQMSREIFKQ